MFKLTIQGNYPDDISDPVFQSHVSTMWRKIADMVEQGKTDGERHMTVDGGAYTIVRYFVDQASAQEFLDAVVAATPEAWRQTLLQIEEVV